MKSCATAMEEGLPMRWKLLLALLLACWAPAWAQDLVLAVSEGTSGGLDHAQALAKYQGLADVIGRALHRKVEVVFAREFDQLEQGMKTHRFDLVLARPSDYPARGMRLYGYQYVASAQPEGRCYLIARDPAIRTPRDLHGRRIVLPEPAAYMTKFCRAELRELGIDLARENVQYVREQGAVAFYVENGFADVGGVASYSGVAKKWEQSRLPVVHRSRPQPYFPLIAAAHLGEAQCAEIRKALLAMGQSAPEQAVLKTLGIDAFDSQSGPRLLQLLEWLGN
jgi:phosphonate transport system substrate-binding protein